MEKKLILREEDGQVWVSGAKLVLGNVYDRADKGIELDLLELLLTEYTNHDAGGVFEWPQNAEDAEYARDNMSETLEVLKQAIATLDGALKTYAEKPSEQD